MITITPNVLTLDEARDLIAGSESAPPMKYYDGIERTPAIRSKNVTDSLVARRIADSVGKKLGHALVLHYPVGSSMNVHCDVGSYDGKNLNQMAPFKHTGIIYLDEGCAGGETFFPELHVIVQPKFGLMLIHPSGPDYLHGVGQVHQQARHTLILRLM